MAFVEPKTVQSSHVNLHRSRSHIVDRQSCLSNSSIQHFWLSKRHGHACWGNNTSGRRLHGLCNRIQYTLFACKVSNCLIEHVAWEDRTEHVKRVFIRECYALQLLITDCIHAALGYCRQAVLSSSEGTIWLLLLLLLLSCTNILLEVQIHIIIVSRICIKQYFVRQTNFTKLFKGFVFARWILVWCYCSASAR